MEIARFRRKFFLIPHRSKINNLPEKLLIEILRRLPEAKSAIRCKLVCRNWCRIISTSRFIGSFLNYQRMSDKFSHFVPQSCPSQLDGFPVLLLRGEEISSALEEFIVLASWNDLLLCRLSKRDYCICNPLTRQYVTLPSTHDDIELRNSSTNLAIGFYCDSYVKKENGGGGGVTINPDYNYRVVFIYPVESRRAIRVQEFSSETNEWRDCNIYLRESNDRYRKSARVGTRELIFHNGMWFWKESLSRISIYDPQNTTLDIIDLPQIRDGSSHAGESTLGVCQGFLRYFNLRNCSRGREAIIRADVWELNGREWRSVHTIFLHELGDLWHAGVKRVREVWTHGDSKTKKTSVLYTFSAAAIDPYDSDIFYIRAGIKIIVCNFREMEMKHVQPPLRSYQIFPIMAPLWPTPIRS